MKMPRKLIVSSLAILVGASLAGSITGTVAWFQYATRAQVAFTGTTAHCSKLLLISLDDGDNNMDNNEWGTDISSASLPTSLFPPITSGEMDKASALNLKTRYEQDGQTISAQSPFYSRPVRGQGLYDNWLLASPDSYVQFTVFVRVKDVNTTDISLANDVYLTDLTIQDASTNGNLDLSDALRVHFAIDDPSGADKNMLFAKNSTSTEVGGFLDISGDGKYDTSGYEWDKQPVLYGGAEGIEEQTNEHGEVIGYSVVNPLMQTSYKANDPTIIAKENDNGEIISGTPLGKTSTSANEFLKITVTIWLEGWSLLENGLGGNTNASVWDHEKYVEKSFNIGMTFGVKLHASGE